MIRKIKNKKNKEKINIILVLMVFISVISPFFIETKINLVLTFIVLLFIFFHRRISLDYKVINLIVLIIVLISIQGYIWGFSLLTIFTYTAFAILTPYFLFKIVGIKLFNYLVKIIYITAFYSLFLWLLQVILPPFDNFLQNFKDYVYKNYSWDLWARSLIFYTVAINKIDLGFIDLYRNSGIYHEPGAFAVWLIFGIGLNTIISKNHLNKKNFVMIIALFSTFSTAGYLMLFLLTLFFIFKSKINRVIKVASIIIFLFISFEVYISAGFMKKKMELHYEQQSSVQLEGTYTTGRLIRIRKALAVIGQSPLIGRGIITAAAANDPYSKYDAETATLGIISKYGLFFGILFFLYFYKGIKLLIKNNNYYLSFAKFFLIAIMMGGLSQRFLYDNIMIQFFFLGLMYWDKSNNLNKKYAKNEKNTDYQYNAVNNNVIK